MTKWKEKQATRWAQMRKGGYHLYIKELNVQIWFMEGPKARLGLCMTRAGLACLDPTRRIIMNPCLQSPTSQPTYKIPLNG